MRVEVIGFRKMDFTTKEGQVIKGSSIYAVYPSKDKFVTGSVVWLKEDNYKNKKLPFVPDSVCPDIALGFYDVITDISNGAIESFVKVK